jgi:hypothetical protein
LNQVPLVPISKVWLAPVSVFKEIILPLSAQPVRYHILPWFPQKKAVFQLRISPLDTQKTGEVEKMGSVSPVR